MSVPTYFGPPARRFAKGITAAVAVGAMVLSGLMFSAPSASADTAPPDPAVPTTVTSDALPTAQINGIVWDQVVVGDTVYAVGSFSTARPAGAAAGTAEVARNNILAYDIRTGEMLSFAPDVNGQIRSVAASPDGTRLYIGGDFTAVDGNTRNRVAAFDIPAGTLVSGWAPSVNASVRGIAATDSAAYFTGVFGRVAGNDRGRAAAVTRAGELLPWAPQLQNRGNDLVISPDGSKVVLAGYFTTVNGSSNPGYGLALVDAVNGALMPFPVNSIVRNGGDDAAIWSLSTDGTSVYGTGYTFGNGGNLEGIFKTDWATGGLTWVEDCHGDTYGAFATPDVVYGVGHSHYCGSIEGGFQQSDPWTFYRGTAFANSVARTTPFGLGLGYYDWGGNPAPAMLHWYPTINTGKISGATQGAWSVTGNDEYVVMGGEFTKVNNQGQQGLVRFVRSDKAPNTDGPRVSGSNWVPTATSVAAGTVRISWPVNWDRDNEFLEYRVIRDGATATPVYTTTARSKPEDWALPAMSFVDRGLEQGSTHTYRIRAVDPKGNIANSTTVTVTVDGTGQSSAYSDAVLADSPVYYWPLNDLSGPSFDWSGSSDLAVNRGVTRGVSGAVDPASIPAFRFDGSSGGFAATQTSTAGPQTFAIEAWFKTTSRSGGKIVGFGNRSTGTSTSYDRHIYLDGSGKVNFGVYPGEMRVVTSPSAYNDGQWHQVVASLDPVDGMLLYVDGRKVGQRTDTTSAQSYNGYWRIGGDTPWSGASFLQGDIDEVAIYGAPLDRQQVVSHYLASGRTFDGATAPSDAYGAAVYAGEPTIYWRMNDTTGQSSADAAGTGQTGRYFGSVTKGATGALTGVTDRAVNFSGGQLVSSGSFSNPTVYSLEAWFNTTTTNGGKIIGFGSSGTSSTSASSDRLVYMTSSGQIVYGAYPGTEVRVTSPASYNDGAWHQVVATQGATGMNLYIDGVLVGSNTNTGSQNYTGYWHVGGDATWGPGGNAFAGRIDEVAVYPTALTAQTVADHFSLGTSGAPANRLPVADFTSSMSKLRVTVDASTSTDSDGTITEYRWDWGDGSPASLGATAQHVYADAGHYDVTLTVTDDRDGVAHKTAAVDAVANQLPTAEFESTVTPLSIAVDAAGSGDPDGSIVDYTWDFGDGTAADGATASHVYAVAGTYDVTLTVTDDDAAVATLTKSIVVPANQAPVAAFTATSDGLGLAVDGAASADSDGTITGFAWNWGDGSPDEAGEATATHRYAAEGIYTVTLTVTDDAGATGQKTVDVTITKPAVPQVLAADSFERSVATGLGSADIGGEWTLSSGASSYSVDGAAAFVLSSGGSTRSAYLSSVKSQDTELSVDMTFGALPTGGTAYAQALVRRIGSDDYRARVSVSPSGSANLQILHGGTALITKSLVGGAVSSGETITLKVQATGASPTTLHAKAWRAGTAEPSDWQITATDSTSALQGQGEVGLSAYVGSGVTSVPYTLRFDDFVAGEPGAIAPEPAPNVAPIAAFTSSATALDVAVDASGSHDTDGTIASYEWEFGDGGTATGKTATHTYAAAGSYSVTLKVTDDHGAQDTTSSTVEVTAAADPDPDPNPDPDPQPGTSLAADAFTRTASNGWGAADTGGAWTLSTSSVSAYSVEAGEARIDVAAGSTRAAYLAGVSSDATDLTVGMVFPALPEGGSIYSSAIARRVGDSDYRARVVVTPAGGVRLQVQRKTTTLDAVAVPGLVTAGAELRVRIQAVGTAPTTIRAKAWLATDAEPADWQVVTTDTTAGLQTAGHIGIETYVGGGVNTVPFRFGFRDLVANPAL